MRFIVVGTSGAGKSTFAQALAATLGVPRVELDALHWLPNWVGRDTADFRALVDRATEGDRWVVDGNYSAVRDVLWPKATDIIWLNFSRRVVLSRIVTRTIRRAITKEALWSGNTESLRTAFFSRNSILLWSLTTFDRNRRKFARLRDGHAFPHLRWHALRDDEDAARLLRAAVTRTATMRTP